MNLKTAYQSFCRMYLSIVARKTVLLPMIPQGDEPWIYLSGVPVHGSVVLLTTAASLSGRLPLCETDEELVTAAKRFLSHMLQRSPGDGRLFSRDVTEREVLRVVDDLRNAGVDLRWDPPVELLPA